MFRTKFFTQFSKKHIEEQEKIELTKKLTITLTIIEFLNLFIYQISLTHRTDAQKKEIKDKLLKIERMIDKMV